MPDWLPGMKVIAINGESYSAEVLDAAIADAMKSHKPIDVLVKNTSTYSTLHIAYYGGQQYPHLVRIGNVPDRIAEIAKAK